MRSGFKLARWRDAAVLSELTATEAIASIGTIKEGFWKLEATRANDQRIRLKIKAAHGCLDCELTPDLRQLSGPRSPLKRVQSNDNFRLGRDEMGNSIHLDSK
jgi:hypothetical protein